MTIETKELIDAYQGLESAQLTRKCWIGGCVGVVAIGLMVGITGHPEIGGLIAGVGLGTQYFGIDAYKNVGVQRNKLERLIGGHEQ